MFLLLSPLLANWVSGQRPYQTASRQCRSCLGPAGASRLANSCCPSSAWFWSWPVWPYSALGWGQTRAGGHCNLAPCRTKSGPHLHTAEATGQRMQLGAGAERISQRCKWKEQVSLRQVPTACPLSRESRMEHVMPVPRPATLIWERRQAFLWSPPDPLLLSLAL